MISLEDEIRALGELLPPAVAPLITAPFVRSSHRYDEFVYRLALGVFRAAGLESAAREPGTAAEIAARAGLEPGRALVPVDWILRLLAVRGVLEVDGAGTETVRFCARTPVPALDPGIVREEQQRQDPSWLPSYDLAEIVAQHYPAFLRGEVSGEEILFSPTRFRLWLDYFSNQNGLYAVNNRLGAIAVEAWMPRGGVAILELGGGLGSAAIALLERLEASGRLSEVREYRFTELVPAFLRRGQQALQARFPGAAFLKFSQLDMNRALEEQGVPQKSVSVVYGVNTLHVARDLGVTLAEIFRALEPGGRLLVSECVRPRSAQAIYAEFVFNLMEAFRSPVLHPSYRPNGGFLTPGQWFAALEAAGFVDLSILPDVVKIRERGPDFYVAALGATRPA